MTQISVKIGRFMCDSAVDDHRLLPSGSRRGHKVTRIFHHDDVIPGISSSSTGDLQGLTITSRNLSLPDFHCWDFGDRGGGEGGLGEDDLEMERATTEEEMESSDGRKDWMDDDYYNRTILAHDNNNRHVSHLFRAFHLSDAMKDESICNEEEEEEEEERKEAEAAAAAAAALPWRSTEQMDAVEDTYKYLLRDVDDDDDDDVDPLATPRVENVEMSDDQRGPRLDPPQRHSPSHSSSSSFRNAALSGGRGGSSTRPELSNCQSLLSLSHWLSEAESRHSEPFCPQHHHVLDAAAASSSSAAAMADPSSIRSSIDRRFSRQGVPIPVAAAALIMQTKDNNDDHQSPSSEGATSAEGAGPVVIATTDDDDDWTMSRHEQVLLWLMSNDLTEKGMEEEEEQEKEEKEEEEEEEKKEKEEEEEVEVEKYGPSASTSTSSTSIDRLPRHHLIISTH